METRDEVLTGEEVERRRELRGYAPGLSIVVTDPRGATFDAVEASARSFFVAVAEPERFRLGEMLEVSVQRDGQVALCRLEVIRKEIHPRTGMALRLVTIDPVNEATLKEMLAPHSEA